MPPSFSAMPMATGVVTDLGAIETSDSAEAPSAQAIPTALTTAVTVPASSAAIMGMRLRLTVGQFS